jgi:hypothetical protein
MEQLIYEINGQKYILVEVLLTTNNQKKIEARAKRHNCIEQGVKEVKQGGIFSPPYAIVRLLVPEKNIIAFNNDDY